MTKPESISGIAKKLHVAPSALRYWDEVGLIEFERDLRSNYRKVSLKTIATISDVILLRRLAIPVKRIKALANSDVSTINQALKDEKGKLRQQIASSKEKIEQIDEKIDIIKKLNQLKDNDYQLERWQFEPINLFHFDQETHLQTYINRPYETVVVIDSEDCSVIECGIIDETSTYEQIRKGDEQASLYLKGLLITESDEPTANNAGNFVKRAKEMGYESGKLLGRFLVSAMAERKSDYYEGWLEVFTKKRLTEK